MTGNARVTFRANGTAVTNLEDFHYYPFGMQMEGIGTTAASGSNKYRYNGKEMNDDFGLNLSDYGARWYDGALGRWWSVDPMGEAQANHSLYSYVYNNPMAFIDPTGMFGEGADGLTNDQWLDQTRKDGGYWKEAKEYMKIGKKQQIQDFEGRKHTIGEDDTEEGEMTAYGTRVYVGGELMLDRIEGYNVTFGGPGDPPSASCCAGWTSYIPIYGGFKDAREDWSNGKYGWAVFNGVMGISDIFLVKSVFMNGGKLLIKGAVKTSGSHSWSATKSYWKKQGIDDLTGGSKHHWGITQETMEKYPGLKPFGNQFPNIINYADEADHFRFGHGLPYKGQPAGNLLERFWFGTTTWFKTTVSYGMNAFENTYRPH